MKYQIINGKTVSNNLIYNSVYGGAGGDTLAGYSGRNVIPVTCMLSNLFIHSNVAPGAGKSYTLTVHKNGVATALTATISDANQIASDLVHAVSLAAGDIIRMVRTSTGAPANTLFQWSFYAAIASDQYMMFGECVSGQTGDFHGICQQSDSETYHNTVENTCKVLMRIDGRLKKLVVYQFAGGASNITITVRKNNSDTALTVTGNYNTVLTATADVDFVSGDYLSISVTINSGSDGYPTWALIYETTGGFQITTGYDQPNVNGVSYKQLENSTRAVTNAWEATEAEAYNFCHEFIINSWSILLDVAPGANPKEWQFDIMVNGVAKSTLNFSLEETIKSNTTTVLIANGDLVSIRATPASVPALARVTSIINGIPFPMKSTLSFSAIID